MQLKDSGAMISATVPLQNNDSQGEDIGLQRHLDTVNLTPHLRDRLKRAGFTYAEQVKSLKSLLDAGFSEDEASIIYSTVKRRPTVISAYEELKNPETTYITTSSLDLDALLGSGLPLGQVTEISGVPGIGKTQLGLQLCANVQIPTAFGGAQGDAVYIDTEGSFVVSRLSEIARETAKIVNESISAQSAITAIPPMDHDTILSRTHYFRIYNLEEFIAIVHELEDFLDAHPRVRVLIIDSVAFHFRQVMSDMAQRSRLLTSIASSFRRFATKHRLAVVLMNQMTTKVYRDPRGSGEETSLLVPALGDSWGHCPTNRIILLWQGGVRHAQLVKSPCRKEALVKYCVTKEGIRDVTSPPTNSSGQKRKEPPSTET